MRIHLPRLGGGLDGPVGEFERLARLDRNGHHQLSDLAGADITLFTQCHMLGDDWRLERIASHPAASSRSGRVMIYDERDRPWCRFPGIFVSMRRRHFASRFQRPWSYFPAPSCGESLGDPDLLFSFVGSETHRSRRSLRRLDAREGVVEFVEGFTFFDASSPSYETQRRRFREILERSRFVLCPRGVGVSSIRLYETIARGRVPVIISDDWVAPDGPNWPTFSLRWPEGKISGLRELILEHDAKWEEMSAAALDAHERFFGESVWFHRVASLCEELAESLATTRVPTDGLRRGAYLECWQSHERVRARRVVKRVAWARRLARAARKHLRSGSGAWHP